MKLMYDEKENIFYQTKDVLIERFTSLLVKIFESTLKSNKIFNVELLIRQNFLTICETPEYLCAVLGNSYVFYYDEDFEDYLPAYKLEEDVIKEVMQRMNLVDIELGDFL